MPGQSATPRTAWVLINPAARRAHRFHPGDAHDLLESRNVKTAVRVAEQPGDLRRLAAEAAREGVDLAFVVGGDGAVREAAGGLAGSETALAVLPGGTANVWAKEIGVPWNFARAIDLHLRGQARRADLGRADGEPFLMLASFGWDAEVVRHVGGNAKRYLGELAYIGRGLAALPNLRPREVAWTVDGVDRRDAVAILVVSNTRLYGGRVSFSPRALVDDGLLDACALSPQRRGDGVRLATRLVRGRLSGQPGVIEVSARELAIRTPGLPFELDGDAAGFTPVTLRLEPQAVAVNLPPGPAPAIFRTTTQPGP